MSLLNTSMLECATLNNNEVVGLVDEFLSRGIDGVVLCSLSDSSESGASDRRARDA